LWVKEAIQSDQSSSNTMRPNQILNAVFLMSFLISVLLVLTPQQCLDLFDLYLVSS
jgi:hypothetical protein